MNASQNLQQMGFIDLIYQSGPIAQAILLGLVIISIYSWAVIFSKWRLLKLASKENNVFLDIFWNSKSMDEVYSKVEKYQRSPVAGVFRSGMRELKKLSLQTDESLLVNIERSLLRATNTEVTLLEKGVNTLATIASASPFIGLFGTVWGIMTAFQRIGASGSANLAVVAPGISEALLATALGIGAAIPAVVAYNSFASMIKRQAVDMDCFTQDFLNIIKRSASQHKRGV